MSDDRQDRVRRRAYELWEQEGGEHGRHEDHWHRAAAEVEETVAAPDGTTLTVPVAGDAATGEAATKPARKRAAAKPSAAKAPPTDPAAPARTPAPSKPRKPKAK